MKKLMYAVLTALFVLSFTACEKEDEPKLKDEPAKEQPSDSNDENNQQSGENNENGENTENGENEGNGENNEGGEGEENGGSTDPEEVYLSTIADLSYTFEEFDAVDEGAGKTWKPVYYTNKDWAASSNYSITKSEDGIAIALNQTGQNNVSQAQFRFQCKEGGLALDKEKNYRVVLKVSADNRSDRSEFKLATVSLGQAGYKNTANMIPVKVENQNFAFDTEVTLMDQTFSPENNISDAFLCFTIGQNGNTTLNIIEFTIEEVNE
jgi:hypothetical protein